MQKWLVSLDTDKVKEYVFATGRLKEIRGASALLDDLNRNQTRALGVSLGGKVIFAGGGSAMVEFAEKGKAEEFLAKVCALYPERTGTASVTGVIEEYDNDIKDRNKKDSFHSALQRAAAHLQKEKLAVGRIPSAVLSQPLWKRCERCGIYPATDWDYDPAGGKIQICAICKAKREAGTKHNQTGVVDRQSDNSPASRLKQSFQDFPEDLEFPNELNELGNYIGLIYADGNSMGNFIRDHINTAEEMEVFSSTLEKAIMKALEEATKPFWKLEGFKRTIPFLPIILGGDDILLITTGKIAMRVASQLCLGFQKQMKALSEEKIKETPLLFGGKSIEAVMSAGVMIAKSSHPLFALEPLAAELLRSAKQLAYQLKPTYGLEPTIDFRVVSSPSANSLDVIRKYDYLIQSGKWATCRPYPCRNIPMLKRPAWSDIEKAIQMLREEKFPRNKLHAWQDLLHASTELQAELDLSVIRAHLNNNQKTLMGEITGGLLHFNSALDLFTENVPEKGQKSSPLPDIEEIYDFCV